MNRSAGWLVAMLCSFVALAMVPMQAGAVALTTPELDKPRKDSVIDQPKFTWSEVEGAAFYEIEVALDNQFTTMTDSAIVRAPMHIPTRTYAAKTHYWRVRAISLDSSTSAWSAPAEFTRRWTSAAEPTGEEVGGTPASRVENLGTVTGGKAPPINQIAFTWDAVHGASHYQVQFSDDPTFQNRSPSHRRDCLTPHTTLSPYFSTTLHPSKYVRRLPIDPGFPCSVNVPQVISWTSSDWVADGSRILVQGAGPGTGSDVIVRYAPSGPEYTLTVIESGEDADGPFFIIPNTGAPEQGFGQLEWYALTLNFEPGKEYYVRVRAVDLPTAGDYPSTPVFGLWSDQRAEPPFAFTPSERTGNASMTGPLPLPPEAFGSTSTDVPVMSGEPEATADAYKFVIALDRDFTTIVGEYVSRSAMLMPEETFDDNGSIQTYFWYALPCTFNGEVYCPVPDRVAINSADRVGSFAKHSQPVASTASTRFSEDREVLLWWGDALTVADSAGTGGVTQYEVQLTNSNWLAATSYFTDNLAWTSTALDSPLPQGTYQWRVRPRDGQNVPLSWSYSQEGFTIPAPPKPTPTPTITPNPTSTPTIKPNPEISATYDLNPGTSGGAGRDVPSKPGKPRVSAVARKLLKVRWAPSQAYTDPVSAYLVMRSVDGKRFKQVAKTSSRVTRLPAKPGRRYWFQVIAVSAAGHSPASRTAVFTMPKR
jgi:hypothetical protein